MKNRSLTRSGAGDDDDDDDGDENPGAAPVVVETRPTKEAPELSTRRPRDRDAGKAASSRRGHRDGGDDKRVAKSSRSDAAKDKTRSDDRDKHSR